MKSNYPYWEAPYVDAMLEFDPAKAAVKVAVARETMNRRLEDLGRNLDTSAVVERNAILSGLSALLIHLVRRTAACAERQATWQRDELISIAPAIKTLQLTQKSAKQYRWASAVLEQPEVAATAYKRHTHSLLSEISLI
jgi:hypothetical protein